jgi:hypothetical protein
MRSVFLSGMLAALSLTGCQSAPEARDSSSASFRPGRSESVEITPAHADFEKERKRVKSSATGKSDSMTASDIVELPKFVVTQKAFLDFGLSVVTNAEVQRGGKIKWVRVGVVIPGSLADQNNLMPWDQILAIDRVMVTELDREAMLQLLFEKSAGERLTLLVMSRRNGLLPVFVTLGQKTKP